MVKACIRGAVITKTAPMRRVRAASEVNPPPWLIGREMHEIIGPQIR
jgi:hypothetical protein